VVLIGLGSNRGDSRRIVLDAMNRLSAFARGTVLHSHHWHTSPVDCPPRSDDFINAAVAYEPRVDLTPEALLKGLKAIERENGRNPAPVRNAPRVLDLDLLLFGTETRNSEQFTLPHPRAVDRRFVLAPAVEVLPDTIWPGTDQTIRQLLAALTSDEVVRRLEGIQP